MSWPWRRIKVTVEARRIEPVIGEPCPPLPVSRRPAPASASNPWDRDGITVTESDIAPEVSGIAPCHVITHTIWRCPGCRRTFSKRGAWSGQLRECRHCHTRFFLRREDVDDTLAEQLLAQIMRRMKL